MLSSVLYSWLLVSIHVWSEQCFRRFKIKLMHQLSHFKWIRMQSFGRRKLDFLHGAKQGKQKMNSCMDVPTHWISHLSTQLVCKFGTWNHFSTLKIGNAKDNLHWKESASLTWRCDSSPESGGACFSVGTSHVWGYSQIKWILLDEIM